MLAIQMTVSLVTLAAIVLTCLGFGFLLRSRQLGSLRLKVKELEQEMLINHADILDLQKEKSELEFKLKELTTPVIPLTIKEEKNQETIPDLTARKKLLTQQPVRKHS